MRKDDKLQLLAGIAAISAVIAMVLILSNLFVIIPLVSEFVNQLPASAATIEDLLGQLSNVKVHVPNGIDRIALIAITGFMVLSITSTVAVSKIYTRYSGL
ncbi:MAG TPA: hypothetical protein VGQ03_03670 [Nitrososphaera sp.]|jgi:uncharacterized protein YybS (DUF2232 family)|nr:hypothetical protein [Nitrososphaera sp.]